MKKNRFIFLLGLVLLSGCSWSMLNPFSGDEKKTEVSAEEQGVNHYLWQAAMDKLAFMGVETADKSSGLMVFKWSRMEGAPQELFQVRVQILCRELRSDGLKVTVLKREQSGGKWQETVGDKKLAAEIENQILLQARKLYRADLMTNRG